MLILNAAQHYGAIRKRSSGHVPPVFSALSPDIVTEKDLCSDTSYQERVALPGFEPGFLFRQHGSKCASLLCFSEWHFGVPIAIGTNSIGYSA